MSSRNKGKRLSIPNHLIDFRKISHQQFMDICHYFLDKKEIDESDWEYFVSIGIAIKTDEGYLFTKEAQCEVME